MAQLITVFWRDIPAQVIVRKSRREQVKRHLGEQFERAIDQAAMRANLRESDAYLAEWRKSPPEEVSGNLEQLAEQKAEELRNLYGPARLRTLIQKGGAE